MDSHILPVPLEKASRLINHGPTVLVSASYGGVDNVMAAAWVCGLDFAPPKVTLVLGRTSKTRELAEKSGHLVVQVPTVRQAQLVHAVGNSSGRDGPDKLKRCGVELFRIDGVPAPLVAGCSAWLSCRIIPDAHTRDRYDLFAAEVTGAWADDRVFRDGHWQFETADADWRSLHYIAGGHFYATGAAVDVPDTGAD
jgi:flavin reductase (DIM6/NTAB) family NADH-FMN oxidoreductase RutF